MQSSVCTSAGGAHMRLRTSVSAACALALLLCGSEAWAAACNGGNCPAANFVVTGIVSPQSAGTVSSVTVEVRTSNGARATGYTGTISFSSSDTRATLPANYRFTSGTNLDNGIHTFTNGVTLKTAGSQSVTATDTVTASLTGSQSAIQVNPAAASILMVSGIPSPQSQNTASPVTVEARDAFGNRATAYVGTVKFTSTDTQATLPANYKFTSGTGLDNGIHSFTPGVTLKTVGTQSVTATDTVTANITGSQTGIVVVSNAATTLVVSGVPSPQAAGTTSTIRVEARDAGGNIARRYTGTVRISPTEGQATRPADHTFTTSDAGIYTFSSLILRTAATQSVTATDIATSSITGTQSGVVVTPGPAATLLVGGITAPGMAGASTAFTGEAKDAFGNRA